MRVETSTDIDHDASLWAARVDRGLSDEEETALETWLDHDARRLGAFARARALAEHSRRAAALFDGSPSWSAPEPAHLTRRGLAASVAVLGVGGAGLTAAWLRRSQAYRTGLGEVRDFVLADGSQMSMSAMSSVSVRYRDNVREIVMPVGEVLFTIVEDRRRPFTILSAGATVVAHGGRLLLRRFEQAPLAVVALDDGAQVRFSRDEAISLDAGRKLVLDAAVSPVALDAAGVERSLAWREGRLAFHDDTLADAARAFSRFSPTPIAFGDEDVAALRITGLFDARDALSFAKAVAVSLNLRMAASREKILLSRTLF